MDNNNDLVFNVAQLLKATVGSTRNLELQASTLPLDEHNGDIELLRAHDVLGKARLTRLSDNVLVQGEVEANVTLECSRCLEQFAAPVEGTLEEQYQPTLDVDTGLPVQRVVGQDDDAVFQIGANHLLDLSEPVRQALLVALPMKPLCKEDCAGICPECGANCNETPCGHENETTDHRWASLQELRLDDFPSGENLN